MRAQFAKAAVLAGTGLWFSGCSERGEGSGGASGGPPSRDLPSIPEPLTSPDGGGAGAADAVLPAPTTASFVLPDQPPPWPPLAGLNLVTLLPTTPAGRYFLTVERTGPRDRATVVLNGVTVFRPGDFDRDLLRAEVTLEALNTLGVEVRGSQAVSVRVEGLLPDPVVPVAERRHVFG